MKFGAVMIKGPKISYKNWFICKCSQSRLTASGIENKIHRREDPKKTGLRLQFEKK